MKQGDGGLLVMARLEDERFLGSCMLQRGAVRVCMRVAGCTVL